MFAHGTGYSLPKADHQTVVCGVPPRIVELEIRPAQVTRLTRRYILHESLGNGSMGMVYAATDRLTNSLVALKRVAATPGNWIGDTTACDSLHPRLALAHEFQTLASMRHPNIISVLDYGFDEAHQAFFTMELLPRPRSLHDAAHRLPLAAQVNLLLQMLGALTYMHRRNIIHRDLKPSNVLVIEGEGNLQVKVLDFGLAMLQNQPQAHSGDAISGTLSYMAPEVLVGAPPSALSDLYSVGVMAYELFAGRHPFVTTTASELIRQILNQTPDVSLLPVPDALQDVVQRLMAHTPEDRYPGADAAIAGLSAAMGMAPPPETHAVRESFLQAADFVGREQELEQLTDALQSARDGHGSAWLIGGESGVGKSRLLRELRTAALVNGALVLRGQGISEGGAAYRVWRDILRALAVLADVDTLELSVLHRLVPDLAALLGQPVPETVDLPPDVARTRLLATTGQLLRRQEQPVVIMLEDLTWAHNEDLALLDWLSKQVVDLPLLIVASYRDDERPTLPHALPDMEDMRLKRLSAAAIRDLSGAMLGEAGRDPRMINLLQRETEGNVFFLVEVVRALAEEAGQLDRIDAAALPPMFAGGVRQMIQRRLCRLPDAARDLLNLAAVLGRQIDPALLRAAAPDENMDAWLTLCANAAILVVQDGVWQFAHDKLREGTIAELSLRQRARLHRQAAEAIEAVHPDSPAYYAALAHHWGVAGDDDQEAGYAALAGAQALRLTAFGDAVPFLERALEIVGLKDPTRAIPIRQRLAESYAGLSGFERARALYEKNLTYGRKLGDLRSVARALYGLGTIEESHADYKAAAARFSESLELFNEVGDPVWAARAIESLSDAAFRQGDYARARSLAVEALDMNREVGHVPGIANTLKVLGSISASQGHFAEASRYFEDSLIAYRQIGQRQGIASCVNNLGIIAVKHGDYEQAKALYHESLHMKTEIGDQRGRASTLNNLSIVTYHLGDYATTRALLEEALVFSESIGDRQGMADAMINLGRTLFVLGDTAEAARLFVYSREICEDIGDLWGIATALLNLGRLSRAEDDDEQARMSFQMALHVAAEIQKATTLVALMVELALLAARQNRIVDALRFLGVALDHPAIDSEYQRAADSLYRDLSQTLPSDQTAEALAHYASLEDAVDDVLQVE